MKDKIEIESVELKPLTKANIMEENEISNIIAEAIKKQTEKMDSQLIHSMYVGARKQVMEDFGLELIEKEFIKYFTINNKNP